MDTRASEDYLLAHVIPLCAALWSKCAPPAIFYGIIDLDYSVGERANVLGVSMDAYRRLSSSTFSKREGMNFVSDALNNCHTRTRIRTRTSTHEYVHLCAHTLDRMRTQNTHTHTHTYSLTLTHPHTSTRSSSLHPG